MPNLSVAQAQAVAFIEQHRDGVIGLAQELIAAPSPNPPGNELAPAQVAAARLRAFGLTDIQIVGPMAERANLICRIDTGRPGPTLLLNGHLDTKPTGDLALWQTNPYEGVLRDGRLYGLGSCDMKGPDAALVYGVIAAATIAKDHLRGQLLLVLSADEEWDAVCGPKWLIEQTGLTADVALLAEPCGITRPWEAIPLISRGFTGLQFTVRGTQTHSSLADYPGVVNASLEASRLIVFMAEHFRPTHTPTPLRPLGPTITLGATLHGGIAVGIVPGVAQFQVDIRTLPGMTQAQMAEDVDRLVAAFHAQHPAAQVIWEFMPGTFAWADATQIPTGHPLVGAVQRAAEAVLGEAPPLGCFPGGSDALWWQGLGGIPTLPGFGPGLIANAHQPNEWVGVEELVQAAKMDALIILDYLGWEADG